MQEFQIGPQEAGQRFDKYLKKLLPEASSGFLYKMLRKKNFTLNGAKATGFEELHVKDEVKLFLSDETFRKFAGAAQKAREYESLRMLKAAADDAGKTASAMPEILYEDADILIVNKPAGMLSQKAGQKDISANEYILNYLIQKGELTETQLRTFRPSVCNRLDRNTSGLLIAGKTLKGLQEMSEALKERSIQKYYRCLVTGELREPAYISGWLIKDPHTNRVKIVTHKESDPTINTWESGAAPGVTGRPADRRKTTLHEEQKPKTTLHEQQETIRHEQQKPKTIRHKEKETIRHEEQRQKQALRMEEQRQKPQRIETAYRPVAVGNGYTELEVHLITGRSHQIRAHLASVGHPVLGDPKYGDPAENRRLRNILPAASQLLHAYRLEFADGRIFTAPVPAEYEAVRAHLKLPAHS